MVPPWIEGVCPSWRYGTDGGVCRLPYDVEQTLPLGPCTVAARGAPGHNRWAVAETPLSAKTAVGNAGCMFNFPPPSAGAGWLWRVVAKSARWSRVQATKGSDPRHGRVTSSRPGHGRVLPTTRKSQERSALGKELCSASDATAKRETQCWSTAIAYVHTVTLYTHGEDVSVSVVAGSCVIAGVAERWTDASTLLYCPRSSEETCTGVGSARHVERLRAPQQQESALQYRQDQRCASHHTRQSQRRLQRYRVVCWRGGRTVRWDRRVVSRPPSRWESLRLGRMVVAENLASVLLCSCMCV